MFFIRKASPIDYLDIASIHLTSWHAAYADLLPESYREQKNNLADKTKMWKALLSHSNVMVWIAYDEKHSNLGFIGYFAQNNDYEITTLYVLPEHQGLGIGAKLMQISVQQILASASHANFYLWVLENNTPAIRFYEKLNFVPNGEKSEELYENTKIVDIKMVKAQYSQATLK